MPYALIDHTADTGLDLTADSPETLFSDAVDGMMSVLGVNRSTEAETRTLQIDPASLDLMLVDLLREVLSLIDRREFVTASVDVRLLSEENGLTAELHGEPYDPDRHRPEAEIKGVTYHGLYVECSQETWCGQVIFDL